MAETISFFAGRPNTQLRFVTKFDHVDSLLRLDNKGCTRFRSSLNADAIARKLEGGTPNIIARIKALRRMALPKQKRWRRLFHLCGLSFHYPDTGLGTALHQTIA